MKNTTKKLLTALALVVVTFWTTPGMADLIQNGSFESGVEKIGDFITVSTTDGTTKIYNWSVTAGTVDYIGGYWKASDGNRSIDLNGSPGVGIMASTSFETQSGATYKILFDMSGNFEHDAAARSLKVSVNNSSSTYNDYTFSKPDGWGFGDMKWKTQTFYFTATSNLTTLSFQSLSSDVYCGPVLDNVRGALVPLPGALVLLGAGLVRLATYSRRKRASI
jgi:choice-of-anchor C domain-containing protein